MSEQGEMLTKLSKSQKKKKAAQKKKLAKKVDKANEEQETTWRAQKMSDEIDARMMEPFNDNAMKTNDFQMLNIRGKLLAHPSQTFLDAFSNLRQSMGRDSYPHRVRHLQRLYQGAGNTPSIAYAVAMGAASYLPLNKPTKRDSGGCAYTDQAHGALGLMVWYPIFSICMGAGDKLTCIALRDTCVLLKTCYGFFRNDITRLEQFVFDTQKPDIVKQLDWVARRIEVPPSPPQTPPHGFDMEDESKSDESKSDSLLSRDPFRAPVVVTKRWSDYDDDDQSLGSPMSIPITPDSSLDIPELDLSGSANQLPVKSRTNPRRPATILIAIPTLVNYSPWFFISKTILPVPRISILTSEDYPRSCQTASLHPMKLQSSTYKPLPGSTGKQRMRMRLEHWVREDVEKNLKAKLALSSTEKKKAEAEAEAFIYNRMSAVAGIHTGETLYFGEPDILGTKVGICVDDVREIVTGRFRGEKDSVEQSKVILIPSAEGWICKRLGELQS